MGEGLLYDTGVKQIAVMFGRFSTGKYLQFVIVYTTTKETIFSKQHTVVGKNPKYNRQIVETDAQSIPLTHLCMRTHFHH